MPYPKAGSLTINETYALTAYVLYLNGIVKKDEALADQTLPKIRMPNRDGFEPDPPPDIMRDIRRERRLQSRVDWVQSSRYVCCRDVRRLFSHFPSLCFLALRFRLDMLREDAVREVGVNHSVAIARSLRIHH